MATTATLSSSHSHMIHPHAHAHSHLLSQSSTTTASASAAATNAQATTIDNGNANNNANASSMANDPIANLGLKHRYIPPTDYLPILPSSFFVSSTTSTSKLSTILQTAQAQQSLRRNHNIQKGYITSPSHRPTFTSYHHPGLTPASRYRSALSNRPHSIDELSQIAKHAFLPDSEFKDDLVLGLEYSEVYLKQAILDHELGDVEMAFVNYARTVRMVSDKIPGHWMFLKLKESHRVRCAARGDKCLAQMDLLKPLIVERYESWRARLDNPMNMNPLSISTVDLQRILTIMQRRDDEEYEEREESFEVKMRKQRVVEMMMLQKRKEKEKERRSTLNLNSSAGAGSSPKKSTSSSSPKEKEKNYSTQSQVQVQVQVQVQPQLQPQPQPQPQPVSDSPTHSSYSSSSSSNTGSSNHSPNQSQSQSDRQRKYELHFREELAKRRQIEKEQEKEEAEAKKREEAEAEARAQEQEQEQERRAAAADETRRRLEEIELAAARKRAEDAERERERNVKVVEEARRAAAEEKEQERERERERRRKEDEERRARELAAAVEERKREEAEVKRRGTSGVSHGQSPQFQSSEYIVATRCDADGLPVLPLESPTKVVSSESGSGSGSGHQLKLKLPSLHSSGSKSHSSLHFTPITTTSPSPTRNPWPGSWSCCHTSSYSYSYYPPLLTLDDALSEHQRQQGYTPSLQSMFSPPFVAPPSTSLLFSANHPEGPSSKNIPRSPDRPPAHVRHLWEMQMRMQMQSGSGSAGVEPPIRRPSPTSRIIFTDQLQKDEKDGLLGPDLRIVRVPLSVIDKFMTLSTINNAKRLETCGMLMGRFETRYNGVESKGFIVNTLLIPRQSGTCDSCTILDEEVVFEFAEKRGLVALGWIHTHPTQSCFMSSLDLHTHAGFQASLREFFAIVCSPSHHVPNCGVFRLTEIGLSTIKNCTNKAIFHAHPEGIPMYTDADKGHVLWINDPRLEIVDLR